jgi:hypothetical protein
MDGLVEGISASDYGKDLRVSMARLQWQELRGLAAPCLLQNLVTEIGHYTFVMEGPQGQSRTEFKVPRNRIDTANNPKDVGRLVIEAMKNVIVHDLDLDVEFVFEHMMMVYPYRLEISMRSQKGSYDIDIWVNGGASVGASKVGKAELQRSIIMMSQKRMPEEIEKKRKEAEAARVLAEEKKFEFLDYSTPVEDHNVASITPQKPPKCPDHEEYLEPSSTVGELTCPILGCLTVARKKVLDQSRAGLRDPIAPQFLGANRPPSANSNTSSDRLPQQNVGNIVGTSQTVQLGFHPSRSPVVAVEQGGRKYLTQNDVVTGQRVWIDITDICISWNLENIRVDVSSWNSGPLTIKGLPDLTVELHPRLGG